MYQFSLHCLDGTTELDTAFDPTHERLEQSENKTCRVCRMLTSPQATVISRSQTTDVTVAVTVRQDKDKPEKIWVLILSICVEKRIPPTKKRLSQRTEDRKHTLFLCSDLVHRYVMIYVLWLSRRICALFIFPSSQHKAQVGNGRFGYFVHTLFFGIQ